MQIIPHLSANFGPRKGGVKPDLIVLHHTAMLSAQAALDRLCDPVAQVSAHYLIARDGKVFQLVADEMRAWHAGAGSWGAIGDVNSRSIGIELCNAGGLIGLPPFAHQQMSSLETLLDDLMQRHAIAPERVIGHCDMAPGRKADPGPAFDWQRLALAGRAVWASAATGGGAAKEPPTLARFHDAARKFGYSGAVAPDAVLAAFRLRFAPERVAMPLCHADIAQIEALARAYPCIDEASPNA
ncbi:MAG: N-acetylmuramoyl-L-alanine amidase [Paracoccaceae bacterium]